MRKNFQLLIVLLLILFISFSYTLNQTFEREQNDSKSKITALVFYGRKRYVEILSKYLIANLKRNGGILEKIKFAVNTKNKEDLDYLDELIKLYPNEFIKNKFAKKGVFANLYKS